MSDSKSIDIVIILTILTSAALITGVTSSSSIVSAQSENNSTSSPNLTPPFKWYGFAMDESKSNSEWKSALQKWSKYGQGGVHRVVLRFSDLDLKHLDQILDLIHASGARAVLDYHVLSSYPGFGPLFGSQGCRDWWKNLTVRYKNDSRVIAFEFANEPTTETLDPSLRSDPQWGILTEYAYLTDMVHEIDPSRICVWMDYWNHEDPTPYYRDNVIVTFHPYSYSKLETEDQLELQIASKFEEVEGRAKGLWPIWCGELESVPGTTGPFKEEYYVKMFKQCIAKGYGFNYWHYYDKLDDGGANPDEILRLAGFTHIPSTYLMIQTPTGMGTTSPGTGKQTYNQLTDVQVLATPTSGWDFNHWILDGSNVSNANPYILTMYTNHTIKAVFTQKPFNLTIEAPSGTGSTSITTGTYIYTSGTDLNLTATPASGWTFDHWELDGKNIGGVNPYTINMNANYRLKAVFVISLAVEASVIASFLVLEAITLILLAKRRQTPN